MAYLLSIYVVLEVLELELLKVSKISHSPHMCRVIVLRKGIIKSKWFAHDIKVCARIWGPNVLCRDQVD